MNMVETGLDLALDELYATGWSALDTLGCEHHSDGRPFPAVVRVQREFAQAGYELHVRFVELFGCYRAEWCDHAGTVLGSVIGASESEAAIYALAQVRRNQRSHVRP